MADTEPPTAPEAIRAAIAAGDDTDRRRLRPILASSPEVELRELGRGELGEALEAGLDLLFVAGPLAAADDERLRAAAAEGRGPLVVVVGEAEGPDQWGDDRRRVLRLADPPTESAVLELVDRARSLVELRETRRIHRRLMRLISELEPERRYLRRLTVKREGRIVLLPAGEVDWIDAARNYVHIHSAGRTFRVRESIGRLEERLDPRHFARIHRSTIVNIERIREIESTPHGDYVAILEGGQRLSLSRTYRQNLSQLLG